MRTRTFYLLIGLSILAAGCGRTLAAGDAVVETAAAATPLPNQVPGDCPVTQPQTPVFVPPQPYTETAPYGQFWYGSNGLWTALYPDGVWSALPENREGYMQKVFWWREGYDMRTENSPQITVSGRRLDGDAPPFEETGGTNGYHPDMGEFMLTGVAVPTAGCWEISGHYNDETLSFVVWVAPSPERQ